jgi:hypothetical protein
MRIVQVARDATYQALLAGLAGGAIDTALAAIGEAVGGAIDLATADLVDRLRTGADAAVFAAAPRSIAPLVPVIDVQFNYDDTTLRWFSIVSTIGTPVDITAQELRLEAFFPSDDDTAAIWRQISAAAST